MKYIKLFEDHAKSDLELLGKDTRLLFKKDDIKIFLIERFDQINSIKTKTAITQSEQMFDIYNGKDLIHFLFIGEELRYMFSIERETKKLSLLCDKDCKYFLHDGEISNVEEDIKRLIKRFEDVYYNDGGQAIFHKINSNPINQK